MSYNSVSIFPVLCGPFFQFEQSKLHISGFTLSFLIGGGSIAYVATSVGALWIYTMELYFCFGFFHYEQFCFLFFMMAVELVFS